MNAFKATVFERTIVVEHEAGHRYSFDRTSDGGSLEPDVMVTPNHASTLRASDLIEEARAAARDAISKGQQLI